jgi:hypothetical protein
MKHISGCPITPFRITYRAWHIQNFQVFGIEDYQAEADDWGGCRLGCLESLGERNVGRMLKRFERAARNGIWREPITITRSTKVQTVYWQAWSSLPVANKKGSQPISPCSSCIQKPMVESSYSLLHQLTHRHVVWWFMSLPCLAAKYISRERVYA